MNDEVSIHLQNKQKENEVSTEICKTAHLHHLNGKTDD